MTSILLGFPGARFATGVIRRFWKGHYAIKGHFVHKSLRFDTYDFFWAHPSDVRSILRIADLARSFSPSDFFWAEDDWWWQLACTWPRLKHDRCFFCVLLVPRYLAGCASSSTRTAMELQCKTLKFLSATVKTSCVTCRIFCVTSTLHVYEIRSHLRLSYPKARIHMYM